MSEPDSLHSGAEQILHFHLSVTANMKHFDKSKAALILAPHQALSKTPERKAEGKLTPTVKQNHQMNGWTGAPCLCASTCLIAILFVVEQYRILTILVHRLNRLL